MISVYVRHVNQEDSQLLGDFAPQDIEPLVALFNKYPTYDVREGDDAPACVLAQFVVTEAGTIFEIVVGPREDT